jgi:hypothetical protein
VTVCLLAAQVSRSKTAIEKPGRVPEAPERSCAPAEAEIKRFVDACDELRDATRRPLTEWEAEQERIKAEEAMNAMHAEALEMNIRFDQELAAKFEDHEMALLMNKDFDRDREEQRRLAEQAQREHEERISRKRQNKPAAMPKRSTKRRLKPQRAVKLKRKRAEAAERQRIEAEQRAARRSRKRKPVPNEKAAAVEAERLKARQAEEKRLAEEKRIADEAAARAANTLTAH